MQMQMKISLDENNVQERETAVHNVGRRTFMTSGRVEFIYLSAQFVPAYYASTEESNRRELQCYVTNVHLLD